MSTSALGSDKDSDNYNNINSSNNSNNDNSDPNKNNPNNNPNGNNNNSRDEKFMREALVLGEEALRNGEIPVGCVFVYTDNNNNDVIIGKGTNRTNETRNGTSHAEIMALNDIMLSQGHDPSIIRRCDLYVTCEPCIMCAAALSKLGIKRVFFGCHNERFGGNGSILSVHTDNRMKGHDTYEVTGGVMHSEAINLFRRFYTTENRRCPEDKRKRKRRSSDPPSPPLPIV